MSNHSPPCREGSGVGLFQGGVGGGSIASFAAAPAVAGSCCLGDGA